MPKTIASRWAPVTAAPSHMGLTLALASKLAAAGPNWALGVTLAGFREQKKQVRDEQSNRGAPHPVSSPPLTWYLSSP